MQPVKQGAKIGDIGLGTKPAVKPETVSASNTAAERRASHTPPRANGAAM